MVKEKELKVEDVLLSDEVFITSSLMEVMPLVRVEGKPIASGKPGEVSLNILSQYRNKL